MYVNNTSIPQVIDFNQRRADRHYQEALAHEHDGELDAAVHAFEQAVALAPEHIDAQLALVAHYNRLGLLDDAIDHCRAILTREPDPTAYFYLGQSLINLGEYDEALDALHQCLTLDPTHALAHHELAYVYYRREDYDVAITEFHRAAQYEPSWETYFFLGECYRQTERLKEAQTVLRKALAIAETWGQIELTRAQMESVNRRMEFPRNTPLDVKANYYCENGIVYLGSDDDDGLNIPFYFFYNFDYTDIAVTLRRLVTITDHLDMHFDAVVPADIISLPLALALARYWDIGTEPNKDDSILLVQAIAQESATLQDALERTPDATTFCLCAAWDDPWLPDIVGVCPPLGGGLPWYPATSVAGVAANAATSTSSLPASPDQVEEILAGILDALDSDTAEPTLDEHGAYYAVDHPRLRFRRSL